MIDAPDYAHPITAGGTVYAVGSTSLTGRCAMNGLMFFDGHRHVFVPADRQGAAVWALSTALLERVARVGQEPEHNKMGRSAPEPCCNTAPAMRLVAAELARRVANAVAFDRAAGTAVQAHARLRWLGNPLTNYGRTA